VVREVVGMRSISRPVTPRKFIDTIKTGPFERWIKVPHRHITIDIMAELPEFVNNQLRHIDEVFSDFATDGTFTYKWEYFPDGRPPLFDNFEYEALRRIE
jgi:hypothetical protein